VIVLLAVVALILIIALFTVWGTESSSIFEGIIEWFRKVLMLK